MRHGHAVDARVGPGVDGGWCCSAACECRRRWSAGRASTCPCRADPRAVADFRRVRERPPVGQSFAGLLTIRQAVDVRRAADEAVGNAVAVLVEHDAGVEIAVAVRVRVVQTNICMRGRWPSGGVPKFALLVPAPSCASARTESLRTAASVVVHLEIAAGFVEAVLVLHVVNEVVQVEQVRHGRRPVRARRLRQVQREVEVERRAAARTGIGVRRIVRIDVGVGLHVVALGRRELGPGSAIRVMPAEG